jgi:hypothetical protein
MQAAAGVAAAAGAGLGTGAGFSFLAADSAGKSAGETILSFSGSTCRDWGAGAVALPGP